MEIRWRVLVALFYPLTIAAISAGLIAFVMLALNMKPLLVGAVTLWFYFISALTIYAISRQALKHFGVHNLFVVMMATVGAFAAIASLLLLLGFAP